MIKSQWRVWVLTVVVIIPAVYLSACGKTSMSVPNVMGVGHNEAKSVLENAGFKVTEIEADASSILPNTGWNRTVKKGTVFKVNDTTYPNYSDDVENPKAKDNKVVIYYAKDDYTYEKPANESSVAPVSSDLPQSSATSVSATSSVVSDNNTGGLSGTWPNNDFTKQLPKPAFNIVSGVSTITGYQFVSDGATVAQLKDYVTQCKTKGFTKDPAEVDNPVAGITIYSYTATNAGGYSLSIQIYDDTATILIMKL